MTKEGYSGGSEGHRLMGYHKGKSSTMLYEQFGELKYKYRSRDFWCRGYDVDTAGKTQAE